MRSIFASWYIADEREAVLEANLDRTRMLAEWLRARAEEGEASGVEAMRLDLEVEVLEREAGAARAEARAWQAAAASWSPQVTGDVGPARPHLPPPPAAVRRRRVGPTSMPSSTWSLRPRRAPGSNAGFSNLPW